MLKVFTFIYVALLFISCPAQDTTSYNDSVKFAKPQNSKWKLIISDDLFFKRNTGIGIIYSPGQFKITAGIGFHRLPLFSKSDSIVNTLPYASNTNTLFYKERFYSNKKIYFRFGLESNFLLKKNKTSYDIGMNLLAGTYQYKDYYADLYYEFYRDSITGNIFYEDRYGDPTENPLNAYAQVRNFSKADMKFNTLGFEPYFIINSYSHKRLNTSVAAGCRYELFFVSEYYYLDYAGVLEGPSENFSKFSWFLRLSLILNLA